jgi:hypothetical protein
MDSRMHGQKGVVRWDGTILIQEDSNNSYNMMSVACKILS